MSFWEEGGVNDYVDEFFVMVGVVDDVVVWVCGCVGEVEEGWVGEVELEGGVY